MAENTVIDYEHLQTIARNLKNEGEALSALLARLRQEVHHLEKEWIGAGSDAFFDEMETFILPSMKRLVDALISSSETLGSIIAIYRSAEHEASSRFGNIDSGSR